MTLRLLCDYHVLLPAVVDLACHCHVGTLKSLATFRARAEEHTNCQQRGSSNKALTPKQQPMIKKMELKKNKSAKTKTMYRMGLATTSRWPMRRGKGRKEGNGQIPKETEKEAKATRKQINEVFSQIGAPFQDKSDGSAVALMGLAFLGASRAKRTINQHLGMLQDKN